MIQAASRTGKWTISLTLQVRADRIDVFGQDVTERIRTGQPVRTNMGAPARCRHGGIQALPSRSLQS